MIHPKTESAPWPRLRPLIVFHDLNTIHENMFEASGVMMRVFEGGMVLDCVQIENHNVRPSALA